MNCTTCALRFLQVAGGRWKLLCAVGAIVFLTAPTVWSAERKPKVILRVHDETVADDNGKFALPMERPSRPGEAVYVGKIPVLTERDVTGIFVYDNRQGGKGVAFRLNAHGRLSLNVTSAQRIGKSFFVFMNGRTIAELHVDRHVQDGILNVPRGWTEEDIALLMLEFGGGTNGEGSIEAKESA